MLIIKNIYIKINKIRVSLTDDPNKIMERKKRKKKRSRGTLSQGLIKKFFKKQKKLKEIGSDNQRLKKDHRSLSLCE